MIWNTIPGDKRLFLWKKLREEIQQLSLVDQLEAIAKFCADIPYGSRTIDYYSADSWPTPWEILYHGSFCTSSISLLMYYTLTMLDIDQKIELYLVEDERGLYLLPVIGNQYILNYELGKISNVPDIVDDFKILQTFEQTQIKKIT